MIRINCINHFRKYSTLVNAISLLSFVFTDPPLLVHSLNLSHPPLNHLSRTIHWLLLCAWPIKNILHTFGFRVGTPIQGFYLLGTFKLFLNVN